MRYAGVLGTVALTELMAHFLSLGWGLAVLLAAFAWVALSGASVAAKARSTEDRLALHVAATAPAVSLVANGGTIGGSVTVNGSHQVNGNAVTAGDHTINGTAFTGQISSSGNIAGGTDISASNNLNAGNNLNGGAAVVGNLYVGGNHVPVPVSRAGGLTTAPGTYNSSWGASVVSFCTQVNNQLQAAGIFT